jgi:hypothetical protein
MAKSKLESKIEVEIARLEKAANLLYHERKEVLAKITVLNQILKND